jgi:hypothetical protein
VSDISQYPAATGEDDGTMPENVAALADAIVGHRIVKVETAVERKRTYWTEKVAVLTLDDGTQVELQDGGDCCAYTELVDIVEHLPSVDHIITAVRPEEDYETWHILADMGEVLEFKVGWSAGNAFYYAYGLNITVVKP